MKKFFTVFFITLGVIFFILLLAAAYFFITDPLNLKPLLFGPDTKTTQSTNATTATTGEPATTNDTTDANPALNAQQEAALQTFGIDPATIPSSITPEQEACFREKLGDERVDTIIAGDAPNATDFFRARGCM